MPIPEQKRPVIVGERPADPSTGEPALGFLGYEINGKGLTVSFADITADPSIITAYAITDTGDIWRYHTSGTLSVNYETRIPIHRLRGAFTVGSETLQINDYEEAASIKKVVLITDRGLPLEEALDLTGGRYNDIVTRYRVKGNADLAREVAHAPDLIRIGFDTNLRHRYAEDVGALNGPLNEERGGLGDGGQYRYAFVQRRVVNQRSGASIEKWDVVTADDTMPLWVGQTDKTLSGTSTVQRILAVIDPLRCDQRTPMSQRPINIADEALTQTLRELTHAAKDRIQGTTGRQFAR